MINTVTYKTIIKFLLGMVFIGSLIGIENSQAWGCVYGLEMLSIGNLIFLITSGTLLLKAFKTENKRTVLWLLTLESGIWIIKYILYKGGYVTGFAGTPNLINVLYDFIAIGTRIFLLLKLATQFKKKLLFSLLLTTLIVAIKINIFALPWFTQKMWEIETNSAKEQRATLIGNYKGSIFRFSDSLTTELEISIDSMNLTIQEPTPFNLLEEYGLEIYSPNNGVIGDNKRQGYSFIIDKFDNDSLVLLLEDMMIKQYLVKMKTER